jgi:isocitrate dehydrogenase
VVEPNADGVWGILTRRDIVAKIVRGTGKNPATTKVRDVATRPLVSVPAETSIRDAAAKISDSDLSRFTVVQGRDVIGIVTETDIFNAVEKYGWAVE